VGGWVCEEVGCRGEGVDGLDEGTRSAKAEQQRLLGVQYKQIEVAR
jgi:hypothetical protein